jgi:hypothetical protein
MAKNLFNKEHKASTPESREGYDRVFPNRCEYHTGRRAVALHQGVWLCEDCAKTTGMGDSL